MVQSAAYFISGRTRGCVVQLLRSLPRRRKSSLVRGDARLFRRCESVIDAHGMRAGYFPETVPGRDSRSSDLPALCRAMPACYILPRRYSSGVGFRRDLNRAPSFFLFFGVTIKQ